MDPVLSEEDDVQVSEKLLKELDKGIDDMEAGRYLPFDEAMAKVEEIVAGRRMARAKV